MSEKIEFIPANELPVAETADGDTLCVEDGELKRKPAYDIKIRCIITVDEENETLVANAELLYGDYATVLEKIENDIPATALVIEEVLENPWQSAGKVLVVNYVRKEYNDDGTMVALTAYGELAGFAILPDNTIETSVW